MRVTQSEFAKSQGVSRQRVSQWIKSEIVTLGPDGRLDLEAAGSQLERHLDFGKRADWETSSGRRIRPKKKIGKVRPKRPLKHSPEVITDYLVQKPFKHKIDGEEFLVPKGMMMRVYSRKGSREVSIAFFPAKRKRA